MAAAAAVLVATAAPAAAAPAVDLRCQSHGGHFYCFIVRNDTSPVTISWTRNGVHVPGWDGFGSYLGKCMYGEVVAVAVTVTDSTGSTTADESFPCNTGPWPEGAETVRWSAIPS